MGASTATKRIGIVTGLLLTGLFWGCENTVVLKGVDGAVELQYDCGAFQAVAHSTSEQAVVRQFAARAARFADESGSIEPVQGMFEAHVAGDAAELERLLVDYLCNGGQLSDPLPNQPYIASSISRARAQAGWDEDGLEIGTAAPQFNLPVLNEAFFAGDPSFQSLAGHLGSYVLITFGGPWCPPCVQELSDLVPIWERFRGRGLSVFEILYKDTPENGWLWNQEHIPGTFQTLVDEGFQVAAKYKVHGVPATYVIGPTGDILWSSEGWGPHMPQELTDALDHILPGAL